MFWRPLLLREPLLRHGHTRLCQKILPKKCIRTFTCSLFFDISVVLFLFYLFIYFLQSNIHGNIYGSFDDVCNHLFSEKHGHVTSEFPRFSLSGIMTSFAPQLIINPESYFWFGLTHRKQVPVLRLISPGEVERGRTSFRAEGAAFVRTCSLSKPTWSNRN